MISIFNFTINLHLFNSKFLLILSIDIQQISNTAECSKNQEVYLILKKVYKETIEN